MIVLILLWSLIWRMEHIEITGIPQKLFIYSILPHLVVSSLAHTDQGILGWLFSFNTQLLSYKFLLVQSLCSRKCSSTLHPRRRFRYCQWLQRFVLQISILAA